MIHFQTDWRHHYPNHASSLISEHGLCPSHFWFNKLRGVWGNLELVYKRSTGAPLISNVNVVKYPNAAVRNQTKSIIRTELLLLNLLFPSSTLLIRRSVSPATMTTKNLESEERSFLRDLSFSTPKMVHIYFSPYTQPSGSNIKYTTLH